MTRRNGNTGAAQAAPTLAELAAQIREESRLADEASLARAHRLGGMLRQARPQVPRGGWKSWLDKNFVGNRSGAALFMRIADPANVRRIAHCAGVKEAEVALRNSRKPSQSVAKRKPRESGKRLRMLHAKRREGDDSTLMNMRIRIQQVVSVLEGVDLGSYGVEDADDETITEVHEELTMLATWLDASLTVLDAHIGIAVRSERIRKLREDTNGRSPAEIATAHRLADKLERRQLVSV